MKSRALIFSIVFLLFNSCKKQPERFCWRIVDFAGNDLMVICDKTEEELIACAKDGSCNLFINGGNLTPCNYYKAGGETYCWLAGNIFLKNKTEIEVKHFQKCYNFPSAVKIDCNYCSNWYTREKRTFKPTNTTAYSSITYSLFCGDTARTIFNGREVVRKNDADSLIILQFSNNGQF